MATLFSRDIKISCDPSNTVSHWFWELLSVTSAPLRRFMLSGLFQALIHVCTQGLTARAPSPLSFVEFITGRTSYLVTDVPTICDLQACNRIRARNRVPVLVVPGYARHRAHQLVKRKTSYGKTPIFTFEALLVGGIALGSVASGLTASEMWQNLIDEYNLGAQDGSRPRITLQWRRLRNQEG